MTEQGECEEEGGEDNTAEIIEVVLNEGNSCSTHLVSSDTSHCMFLKLLPFYSRHMHINEGDRGQTCD